MNTSIKQILHEGVSGIDYPYVFFKSYQASLTNAVNLYCTRVIPLTIIGVVNGLSPIACVILAFIFLKERLKKIEVIFLFLIAAGIIDVICGASKTLNPAQKTISQAPFLYIALFCNPFLIGAGIVAMRKVKHIHCYVITFWQNIVVLLMNLVLVLCLEQQIITIMSVFSVLDWFYVVMTAVCQVA